MQIGDDYEVVRWAATASERERHRDAKNGHWNHLYLSIYLRGGRVLLVDDAPVVGLDRVPALPPLEEHGAPDGEEDVEEGDPLCRRATEGKRQMDGWMDRWMDG